MSRTIKPGRRRLLSAGTLAMLSALPALTPTSAQPRRERGGATLDERFVEVAEPEREPPPLVLNDLEGRRHDLADYRGRVVLVNFWATWCAPCLEEMPALQLLQARLDKAPFSVLLVNYGESIERVNKYADNMALDLPVLLDAFHRVRHDWKVRALPMSFLIDAQGRLRYTVRGEIDWIDDRALARIEALLPAQQRPTSLR